MKKAFFIITVSIFLLFSSACGNNSDTPTDIEAKNFLTIEDDAGRKITLNEKPERIVVTSASFLELLHSVGADIVGIPDSKNKTPDWAKNIPTIGHVYQIDVERLLACKPDIVILNKGMNEKLLDILNKNGISALVMEIKTYEEVKHALKIFSELSGDTEKGEQLIKKMDEDIKKIIDKIPAEKKKVAVIHSTNQGLTLQLDNSIAGNIVKMLGWENIASEMSPLDKKNDSAPYSMETLVEKNPEIIFVTSMGNLEEIKSKMQEMINSNEAWQSIQAIKNNQIYYLPQDKFLLSPGLDYPKAVKDMVQLVYPSLFK